MVLIALGFLFFWAFVGAGYLRERKFRTDWMLLTIPVVIALAIAAALFLLNESDVDFAMFFFISGFPIYYLGRVLGRIRTLGLRDWIRQRTPEHYIVAIALATFAAFMLIVPVREANKSHRPIQFEVWNCGESQFTGTKQEWFKFYCSATPKIKNIVKEKYERAKSDYFRERYQDCLKHLNEVARLSPDFQSTGELYDFCIYGLEADIQFARMRRAGYQPTHDRQFCDGPPGTATRSSYCRLDWDQKIMVQKLRQMAESNTKRGKYEDCAREFADMHTLVGEFDDSSKIESICQEGFEVAKRQKALERKTASTLKR